ncbi:MAG: group I intron-associated PD-(D/E)XK endonuclease [Candidatus Sulfotelmatobacter sp.]
MGGLLESEIAGDKSAEVLRFAQDDKNYILLDFLKGKTMKKKHGAAIGNCKRRGEWAEMVFAARALRKGLVLLRPWGESSGYDFVVDGGAGRMVRVQVKSTTFPEGTGYSCTLKDSRGPYKKNTFDFVAAYVIPEDVWFILPEKTVRGMWSVGLYPRLEGSKYNEYNEAWHLLRGEAPEVVGRIEACAEQDSLTLRRHE